MSEQSMLPRNHVEIVSHPPAPGVVPARVFVDGTEVLLAEDGLEISGGFEELTVVTLKLIPSSITIH